MKDKLQKTNVSLESQQALCEKLCKEIAKRYNEEHGPSKQAEIRRLRPGAMYVCDDQYTADGIVLFVGFKQTKYGIKLEVQGWNRYKKMWREVKEQDIDFTTSRTDRRHYIYMMPMLSKIRELLLREDLAEVDFKKLVKGETYKACGHYPSEDQVDHEVRMWKLDLKWKRAILHDDKKALRMIVKRLTKKL